MLAWHLHTRRLVLILVLESVILGLTSNQEGYHQSYVPVVELDTTVVEWC